MVNLTLAIPDSLQKKMKMHSEIRWSEVVRKTISKQIEDLEIMDKLVRNSKLTEEDVAEIAEKIDNAAAKKLGLK
jgi:predicted CopG family antitoxin